MLFPVLSIGVFATGFVMPLLPQKLIEKLGGSNSLTGNIIAAIFGAFMYFSTLTEIPILQALIAKRSRSGWQTKAISVLWPWVFYSLWLFAPIAEFCSLVD